MNVSLLLSFPERLADVVAGADEPLLVRRPRSGGFSLVEHAWHLADLEREGYGVRIMRLLSEEKPVLPDFDGDSLARRRVYLEKPLAPAVAEFTSRRRENVMRVRDLPVSMMRCAGYQEGVGRVTLARVVEMMGAHDAAHAAEIAALLGELGMSAKRELLAPWLGKDAGRGSALAGV